MADISKCTGEGCPLKESCYRYLVPESKYLQSYFMEVPYKDGACEYYWKVRKYENGKFWKEE